MDFEIIKAKIQPFQKYIEMAGATDINVNKPHEIWVERNTDQGSIWESYQDENINFDLINDLGKIIAHISGQDFNDVNPSLAAKLPHYGYRVQLLKGSNTKNKISISIRVPSNKNYLLEDYLYDGNKEEKIKQIKELIKNKKNILIGGGTGSGKTTFMNTMLAHIPHDQRIITIEDTEELEIQQPNWLSLLLSKSSTDASKMTYKDLINISMRSNPSILVMGEIDIENTMPFLRILNTGHGGAVATVHADDPIGMIKALQLNGSLNGYSPDSIKDFAKGGIDYLIHIDKRNKQRYITVKSMDEI